MRQWIPRRSALTKHTTPSAAAPHSIRRSELRATPPPVKSGLDATEEERLRAYEAKWAQGGSISFLYSFTDLLINKESNETASEFVRRKIRATVEDPKTAALLCPNDHPIGTKRLILDTDYYETYNRDNVTLVDIRSKPIEKITPTGLRTADADYALDAIVFATGFDAMTGAMKEIDIHTDAGMSVRKKWEGVRVPTSRS
jgi:cyclohexanone monooxygenase